MVNKDNESLSGKSKYGSRNDNTKNIKGNKQTEYDLFNINVKKAEKDVKQVFRTAKNEMDKFQKEQQRQTERLVRETQKSYENMINNVTKNYQKSMSNLSATNAFNSLGGNNASKTSTNFNNSNNNSNSIESLKSQLENLMDSKSTKELNNKWDSKLADKLGGQINKDFDKGLKNLSSKIDDGKIDSKSLTTEFSKLTDKQVTSMDKINKLGPVLKALEIAFNGIKAVIDKWEKRFFGGMDKIVSTYERTYEKVSVVTDINQKNYADWQNRVSADLQKQGLNNNVTVTNAMEEMYKLTSEGITDFKKASDMSMQNIVNNIINPFVETSTAAYTDLQMKFGKKFTDNITGMSQYLADMSGSNRVFKNTINDILTTLEPVALASEKQLMSGQEYAVVESLVNNGLMSEKEAVSLVSKAANTVADQYGALQSGDVTQQVAVATGQANDMTSALMSMINTAASNGSSIDNPLMRGAYNYAFGINDWSNQSSDLKKILNTALDTYGKSNERTLESSFKKAYQQFNSDENTTAEQQKSNIAENAATWLATFKEQYPDWYTFLESIAGGVKALVTAYIGGKLLSGVGKLLGIGGGGSGGGLLGGLKSFFTGRNIYCKSS